MKGFIAMLKHHQFIITCVIICVILETIFIYYKIQ